MIGILEFPSPCQARSVRIFRLSPSVVNLALAVVLLIGASLMMRTLVRPQRVEIGFEPARLLTMRVPLPDTRYPTPERRAQFFGASSIACARCRA
jgi:hypothetical protein